MCTYLTPPAKSGKSMQCSVPIRAARRRTSSGVKAEDVKSKPHSGLPPELERRVVAFELRSFYVAGPEFET